MSTIGTREEAFTRYQALIDKHGLQWTPQVPIQDWETLMETLCWLSIEDRRRAAGLPIKTRD